MTCKRLEWSHQSQWGFTTENLLQAAVALGVYAANGCRGQLRRLPYAKEYCKATETPCALPCLRYSSFFALRR